MGMKRVRDNEHEVKMSMASVEILPLAAGILDVPIAQNRTI